MRKKRRWMRRWRKWRKKLSGKGRFNEDLRV